MKKYDEIYDGLYQKWAETPHEELSIYVNGQIGRLTPTRFVPFGKYAAKVFQDELNKLEDIKEKAELSYWMLLHSADLEIKDKNELIYFLALAAGVTEKRKIVSDDPIA